MEEVSEGACISFNIDSIAMNNITIAIKNRLYY